MTSVAANDPIQIQIGRFHISEIFSSNGNVDSEASEDSTNLLLSGKI